MADGMITTVLSTGGDAFTNLWDIEITWPNNAPSEGYSGKIKTSARAQGFTPPAGMTISTYPIKYKTATLTRPGATIEGEKKFTIKFRADQNYTLYRDFLYWKHLLIDPSGETELAVNKMYTEININASKTGTIKVRASRAEGGFPLYVSDTDYWDAAISMFDEWIFYDVVVMDVKLDAFSRDNSAAQTLDVDFIYVQYKEPGSSIESDTDVPTVTA